MPFPHLARAASAVAALALAAGGCGSDDDDRLEEASLRECLAAGEFEIGGPGGTSAPALRAWSPDFTAKTSGGVDLDVIVEEDDRAAARVAADANAALLSLGLASGGVLTERNVVVVLAGEATTSDRASIEDCLGA